VDVIELLSKAGAVEPADPDVLEAALRKVAEAAGRQSRQTRVPRRTVLRSPRLIAAAAAAVLAAAGSLAVVTRLDHDVHAGSGPAGSARSAVAPFASARASARPPTIAAILTAYSASGGDILKVTKTMSGDDGTLGETIIWISPADAAPGTVVRSTIQQFTLAGGVQADTALSYTAPTTAPVVAGSGCGEIFGRPRAVAPGTPGIPGTLTAVNYLGRVWTKGSVTVQAATVPGAAALRGCLNDGQWQDVGNGVLSGMKVIELVAAGGYEHLWVRADDLLPVRLVSSGPDVDTITFTFEFLPTTAANQAVLSPPSIPAGFAEVSAGQGS
jgi:hypothetical protein